MRVLFIDDDETSVQDALEKLKSDGHECIYNTFENVGAKVKDSRPDIVILDMMQGVVEDPTGTGGITSFEDIWNTRFCPIIAYSANPDLLDEAPDGHADHPFVAKISKGKNSEDNLSTKVQEFKNRLEIIENTRTEIDGILQNTIREVVPYIFREEPELGLTKEEAIRHLSRRRVAASMDKDLLYCAKIAPWEQYIYPPLDSSPELGDILLEKLHNTNTAEGYKVILSPSCDLVTGGGRGCKVENVLVACCDPVAEMLDKAQIGKKEDKLTAVLTQGYVKEFVPLPALPGVIPNMVINLKKLQLIPYSVIKNEDETNVQFLRIASIDSPFKEQISWAYMQTACRPGVPDRNFEVWKEQIFPKATIGQEA